MCRICYQWGFTLHYVALSTPLTYARARDAVALLRWCYPDLILRLVEI